MIRANSLTVVSSSETCSEELPVMLQPPPLTPAFQRQAISTNRAATIVTGTDCRWIRSTIAAAALFLAGCQSEPTVQTSSSPAKTVGSCLERFEAESIDQSLQTCNKAITDSPNQPELLRDRSVLLTIAGKTQAACVDVTNALTLLDRSSGRVDPMLRHELQVRQATCRQFRTMAGRD